MENEIKKIDHITLEVGETSGCVPNYLEKLFPIAIENNPVVKDAELKIIMAEGNVALDKTPEMLPQLKQAGVVDSGGQGLVEVLAGIKYLSVHRCK